MSDNGGSWLSRLRSGLSQSSEKITGGITGLFTKRKLDQAALDDLEEILIAGDLGVGPAVKLTQSLAEELPGGVAAVALNPGVIDTDMLRSAWGDGAAAYPDPEEWARRAVPFLEKLGAGDNGGALSV